MPIIYISGRLGFYRREIARKLSERLFESVVIDEAESLPPDIEIYRQQEKYTAPRTTSPQDMRGSIREYHREPDSPVTYIITNSFADPAADAFDAETYLETARRLGMCFISVVLRFPMVTRPWVEITITRERRRPTDPQDDLWMWEIPLRGPDEGTEGVAEAIWRGLHSEHLLDQGVFD